MWESEHEGGIGGISGSIRKIMESFTAFLATKAELIGIELQEEKRRVIEILVLASFSILFAILALIVISFTLVVIFWEQRIAVLIILSALYTVISFALYSKLQKKIRLGAKIFETTVDELKKDSEWMNRHL